MSLNFEELEKIAKLARVACCSTSEFEGEPTFLKSKKIDFSFLKSTTVIKKNPDKVA